MRRYLLAALTATAAVALAAPAGAVVTPFGGPADGVDPLGNAWSTSSAGWGEPGVGQGTQAFNPLNVSNNAGAWANELDFIFLMGLDGEIDFANTTFQNVTKGETWTADMISSKEVHFLAPTGSRIDPGDVFSANVAFNGDLNANMFSFAGLWTDSVVSGSVPEPAGWTMMIVGFGGLGALLRRRRAASLA
jgi:hypothetical protein